MAPERRSGAGDRAEIRSAAADASPERWRKSAALRGSARADPASSQSPRADPNLPDEMPPLLVQFEQAEMSADRARRSSREKFRGASMYSSTLPAGGDAPEAAIADARRAERLKRAETAMRGRREAKRAAEQTQRAAEAKRAAEAEALAAPPPMPSSPTDRTRPTRSLTLTLALTLTLTLTLALPLLATPNPRPLRGVDYFPFSNTSPGDDTAPRGFPPPTRASQGALPVYRGAAAVGSAAGQVATAASCFRQVSPLHLPYISPKSHELPSGVVRVTYP